MEKTLVQLYGEKGQVTTELEIGQAKLREINQQIINLLNGQNVQNGEKISQEVK